MRFARTSAWIGVVAGTCGASPPFVTTELTRRANGEGTVCVVAGPRDGELVSGDVVLSVGSIKDLDTVRALLHTPGPPVRVTYVRGADTREALVSRDQGADPTVPTTVAPCRTTADALDRRRRWEAEDRARDERRELFQADPPSSDTDVALVFGAVPSTDAVTLHVRVARPAPDAPTLVVINGGPGKSHDHLTPLERYAAAGYSVITYDQRGVGLSTRPISEDAYGLADASEDLEAIREWLGVEQIVALGHSWGCLVAADWAARHPDRAAGLVMVGCGPLQRGSDPPEATAPPAPPRVAHTENLSVPPDLDPSCERWWRGMQSYYFDLSKLDAAALAGTCHDLVSAANWRAIGSEYDLRPGLSSVHAPALVVYGAVDPWIHQSKDDVDAAFDGAATSVEIPECGHRPMLECPDAFDAALLPFLSDLRPRDRRSGR